MKTNEFQLHDFKIGDQVLFLEMESMTLECIGMYLALMKECFTLKSTKWDIKINCTSM